MSEEPLKLSQDQIAAIMSDTRGRGPAKDPTEPRNTDTWFALNHHIKEDGCENLECKDPRPKSDRGTNICASVKGRFMCRYCYVDGWLSDKLIGTP